MSPQLTRKHHVVGVIIVLCLSVVFGTSLLTRERYAQSGVFLPHSQKMLANHVKVNFITERGRKLKTYYWSTSHSKGRGTDVTDIFNSDIIEADSGLNNHIPIDYAFDQTDLRNIRALKNVRLGETINLVVTKMSPADRPTGLQRLYKWLVTG
ncbi:hypothetical protein [Secundilactobacillus folii]|uniref:Uncharacterized protein n=1 Tax=Secundilactobacillus folii TaxID=2678357 RepID=A0A7X3C3F0_9LACO|nr:hypothetical protein [Secundilactobacillus folii]MTV82214.1 hypothetical protein [Secundilactobacillus folii]